MPYTGKKKPGAPTLGVFVPCDPRIDEGSRTRAFNIGRMTAALLAKRLRLPDGTAPNVFTCSRLVDSESAADAGAREMLDAGVGGIVIVPDTWFFPGKTAMALTAHFAPTVPLACVGGNNAPKPGVVGIDALVGAYAQTGRLCPMVIGNMPETGLDPEYDAGTQDEIVDLAYAMLARIALQGKRFVSVDTDSMQMETALNHVHAARRFFGLESTRESMKLFADMLRKKGGYDPDELKALRDWVVNVKFKGRIFTDSEDINDASAATSIPAKKIKAPALSAADKAKLDEGLALYLIIRNYMRDVNAVGGGWTNQLAWGSDRRGLPMTTADIAESLFNSTEDHTGKKTGRPVRHGERHPGPPDHDRLLLPLRRQAHSFHGLPQGLRALGDRGERPGPRPRPQEIPRASPGWSAASSTATTPARPPSTTARSGSCSRPSSSISRAWAFR
ncbi:MAG: hypothetical protein M0C28_46010 [Candidatus Moduliflexus flocculans]|nr:hypothetical protein [Candidatus Moduliflexus flocculans]